MSASPVAVARRVELYRALLVPRLIEEKMLRLIRQGRLSKWFSGYGQEAIGVGCAWALRDEDYILPMHRDLGVWTTRGVPLKPLFCQLMGRKGGFTKGRDRTFHFGLPEKRIIGMISHLGAMLPVACGLALAAQLRGRDFVALGMIGEGATREGDFHEALNLAAVWKLPVVFVVENNLYGLSTPAREVIPIEDLADAAAGYGMPGEVVDGNDVERVAEAVSRAAERARSGGGPTLLEMKTFRMRGHEEASGTKYVPPELFEEWGARDPLVRMRERLIEEGEMDEGAGAALRAELSAAVEEAAEYALAQPEEESTLDEELADVYAPQFSAYVAPGDSTREARFVDAIQDALREAMRGDPNVMLLGQDIAEYGGVFKVTEGLLEEFGRERVRNTPIIESGALGAALGLALEGFKPIVEMQYADFISVGFNQIVNNLATTHYRWGAPVNVTIRAPHGGSIGAGPFHSQSMEAWFTHVPGLKVVVPSTVADAKGLLLAAIEDPNPVLFFEHKRLYRSLRGPMPEGVYHVPFGEARIVRPGEQLEGHLASGPSGDLTIVTWGLGVVWAEEEAAYWVERGTGIEVIDLRTLIPWDQETVLDSLRRTNRLIVLYEAPRTGGFGAEIAAQISEAAFEHLDAPPVRVAGADMPIPFGARLEQDVYVAHSRLREAVERVLRY